MTIKRVPTLGPDDRLLERFVPARLTDSALVDRIQQVSISGSLLNNYVRIEDVDAIAAGEVTDPTSQLYAALLAFTSYGSTGGITLVNDYLYLDSTLTDPDSSDPDLALIETGQVFSETSADPDLLDVNPEANGGGDTGGSVDAATLRQAVLNTLLAGSNISFELDPDTLQLTIAVTGLPAVAQSGSYTDLLNKPLAYTDERAQDAAAALLTSGSHTGISFVYDDANARVNAVVNAGTGSATVGYDSLPAGVTITVTRGENGTWPVRPSSRNDLVVIWRDGGTNPAPTESAIVGFVPNVDIYMP
jgi:hypothetical protein